MALNCSCPPPTSLTAIPAVTCDVNIGQIVRVAFQRRQATAPFVDGVNDIEARASWDTFIAAADDTKIVITGDQVANPVIEAGDAVTLGGGDNSTAYGVTLVTDINPSSFSVDFQGLSSEAAKAMKELVCEKDLTVFFINNTGKIIASLDGSDHEGFKIEAMFVGDRGNQGYGSFDTHTVSFQLPSGWDNELAIVEPEAGFDPRYDI
jgi:hypothetical protein